MTFAESTEKAFIKIREGAKRKKKRSLRSHVFGVFLEMRRGKKVRSSFSFFLSFSWRSASVPGSGGGWRKRCVNDEATWVEDEWRVGRGCGGLIWPASWPRLRRQSRSPCRWGKCWWTPRACRRCSGTSRWPSSLWGCRSLGTSLSPPGQGLSNVGNQFGNNRPSTFSGMKTCSTSGFLFFYSPTAGNDEQ